MLRPPRRHSPMDEQGFAPPAIAPGRLRATEVGIHWRNFSYFTPPSRSDIIGHSRSVPLRNSARNYLSGIAEPVKDRSGSIARSFD